jgi:hypothetical protein
MTDPRTIVGSILQSGRIFKAGDEDALAKVLPAADSARLIAAGQLSGDWSAASSETPADQPSAEQPSTSRATRASTKKATKRGRA